MQERLVFYYKPSCVECSEVESIVESVIANYDRVMITPSENPGKILVWNDTTPSEADESMIPGVPALWDRASNHLMIGRGAILAYLA